MFNFTNEQLEIVLIISLSFKSKHLQQQNLTNTNAKVLYRKTLKPIRN